MRPDWKYAPDWAQFVAQDEDGRWCWYAARPVEHKGGYWIPDRDDSRYQEIEFDEWEHTLEMRPDE